MKEKLIFVILPVKNKQGTIIFAIFTFHLVDMYASHNVDQTEINIQ